MAEEALPGLVDSDEDYTDAPAPKKPRNDNSKRQDHFYYHVDVVESKMKYISNEHRSCNMLIIVDSPFSTSYFVEKSRHSTGDTTWDMDIVEFAKRAIEYKTANPDHKFADFLAQYVTTPVTETRLQEALRLCVQEGKLAPRQYDDIFNTVAKKDKEDKQRAKNKKKNSEKDFSSLQQKSAAAVAMECDLTGDGGEGEEEAAAQGDARASRAAVPERQATNGSLGAGAGGASGAGHCERDDADAEAGPATAGAVAGLPAGADEEGSAAVAQVETAAVDEAGPSQPAPKRPKRTNAGQKMKSFVATLQQPSSPSHNRSSGKQSDADLSAEEKELLVKMAEEVHLEMFLENKASGSANPTHCPRYLQKTAAMMIATRPEGSEGRAHLEAYFSNEQNIRNLANNKLGIKAAVFQHVREYEKEKDAAQAAAAAAQLAIDRFGDLQVPLPVADEEEVLDWMQRFLEEHVEVIPPRLLGLFKAPTKELKEASKSIITRAKEWKSRHSTVSDNIDKFCAHLESCVRLALR